MSQVNILSMKWGTKYDASYVNTLYSMVERHLTKPFRFICLTDNEQGIREEIDCLPLIPLDIPNGPERGWDKLTSFSNPLYNIEGSILFLDLDVVIVDNIDCFFEQAPGFHIIKDWVRKDVTGNSSVYRFEANQLPDILENFKQQHQQIRQQHRNEQEYLSHYVATHHQLNYWPDSWCKSFKYDCMGGVIGSWFKTPILPDGAKIIVFHGNPNPPDAIKGTSSKWYRKVKRTDWVKKHWK